MPRDKRPTVHFTDGVHPATYACDHCDDVSPAGSQHSIVMATFHVHKDDTGLTLHAGHSPIQGYACSREHAIEVAWKHFDEHLVDPDHGESISIPPQSLPSRCALDGCNERLLTDWYQVAASYNHRGHPSLPGIAYWDVLPGKQQLWFCSMDHAKTGFESIMDLMDNEIQTVDPAELATADRPSNRRR